MRIGLCIKARLSVVPKTVENDGLQKLCENSALSPEGTAEISPGRQSWEIGNNSNQSR